MSRHAGQWPGGDGEVRYTVAPVSQLPDDPVALKLLIREKDARLKEKDAWIKEKDAIISMQAEKLATVNAVTGTPLGSDGDVGLHSHSCCFICLTSHCRSTYLPLRDREDGVRVERDKETQYQSSKNGRVEGCIQE